MAGGVMEGHETEIGIGQTWKSNSITPRTSTAVYFEAITLAGLSLRLQSSSRGLAQFVTHYQHSSSQQHLVQVMTITHNFAGHPPPGCTSVHSRHG